MILYAKTMHPIWSLYFKYDFFCKRMFRLTIVIWQVSLITIFCIACFLNNVDKTPIFKQLGDLKLYVIGFCFGFITLPPPGWFFHFF